MLNNNASRNRLNALIHNTQSNEEEEIVEETPIEPKAKSKRVKPVRTKTKENEYNYEIIETIYSKPIGKNGNWFLELNLMKWNEQDEEPIMDLRKWKIVDGKREVPGKGISVDEVDFLDMLDKVDELYE